MYKVVFSSFRKETKVEFDKLEDALALAHAMEKAKGYWGIQVFEFVEKCGFVKEIYSSRIPKYDV